LSRRPRPLVSSALPSKPLSVTDYTRPLSAVRSYLPLIVPNVRVVSLTRIGRPPSAADAYISLHNHPFIPLAPSPVFVPPSPLLYDITLPPLCDASTLRSFLNHKFSSCSALYFPLVDLPPAEASRAAFYGPSTDLTVRDRGFSYPLPPSFSHFLFVQMLGQASPARACSRVRFPLNIEIFDRAQCRPHFLLPFP